MSKRSSSFMCIASVVIGSHGCTLCERLVNNVPLRPYHAPVIAERRHGEGRGDGQVPGVTECEPLVV